MALLALLALLILFSLVNLCFGEVPQVALLAPRVALLALLNGTFAFRVALLPLNRRSRG